MKNKFYLLLLGSFILCSISILAQPIDDGYKEKIDKFFSLINDDKYDDAINYIYSSNPWMKAKTDEIAKVRSSFTGLKDVIGKYLGNEFLIGNSISSRYLREEYIVYFERQPIRFYFDFYKPKDTWITYSFGFDPNVDEWLEEKTKTEFLYR